MNAGTFGHTVPKHTLYCFDDIFSIPANCRDTGSFTARVSDFGLGIEQKTQLNDCGQNTQEDGRYQQQL